MATTQPTDEEPDAPADDQTTFAGAWHADQTRINEFDEDRCECRPGDDLECARCAIANGGPLAGEEEF